MFKMLYLQSLIVWILNLLLFTFSFSQLSFGQEPRLKSKSWRENWKIDFKTGSGALLSEVPEKYLDRINNVNIPLRVPGITGILSVKKGLTPHFEMGYQFDYIRINGNVEQGNSTYNVLTQSFGNSFLVLYNLKKTDEFRPRFNFFVYYKIGAISLKNDPKEIMQDESLLPVNESSEGNKFINNVAIITGFGIGINHQITNNLSLTGTFELNRSSDAVGEVYKINKIFYHSSNTVNNYCSIATGLCYSFNFSEHKKSTYFNPQNETDKRLIQNRIVRRKGKTSIKNKSIWYDHKRGNNQS